MHTCKISPVALLFTQAPLDLFEHSVRILLRSAVLREPRDARLSRVPVAPPIDIEVRSLVGEPPQCIAENRYALSGLRAAQFHLSVFEPAVGCVQRRCRAQIKRACHSTASRVTAQVRVLPIKLKGKRVRAVHILFDHRYPRVFHVAR